MAVVLGTGRLLMFKFRVRSMYKKESKRNIDFVQIDRLIWRNFMCAYSCWLDSQSHAFNSASASAYLLENVTQASTCSITYLKVHRKQQLTTPEPL